MAKPKLTDYEYITKIQQNLLNNNINQALKYLVNVNLYHDLELLRWSYFRYASIQKLFLEGQASGTRAYL